MHLDNWQGVKLLRSYTDSLQKRYRKELKDIITYVYPDSTGCEPCPEEPSKALIDLPIKIYPKWTSFNDTLLTIPPPQALRCPVNQLSRAQQQ